MWKRDFEEAGKGNYTGEDNITREVDYIMQCDTYNYTNSKELNAKVIMEARRRLNSNSYELIQCTVVV